MVVTKVLGVAWNYMRMTFLVTLLSVTACAAAFTMYHFNEDTQGIKRAELIIAGLTKLELALVDAESGQRGYLITDDRGYLDVYFNGLERFHNEEINLAVIGHDEAGINDNLLAISNVAMPKLAEMAKTIELRQVSFEAAQAEVDTHLGKNLMSQFRLHANKMIDEQQAAVAMYEVRSQVMAGWATLSLLISNVCLFVYLFIIYRSVDLARLLRHPA